MDDITEHIFVWTTMQATRNKIMNRKKVLTHDIFIVQEIKSLKVHK